MSEADSASASSETATAVARPQTSQLSARPTASNQDRTPTIVVRDDIDPNQDAFVQNVVDVFEAKVDRVMNAPARRDAK